MNLDHKTQSRRKFSQAYLPAILLSIITLVTLTSSVNNQEATVTKNPMEQIRLEFQMLRAKQNLIAPTLTENITITAKNCPVLYREIAKIAHDFKLLTPEITIAEIETGRAGYKQWISQYDYHTNHLTLGKQLLTQLTIAELRNLIASEISYGICMANNSTGRNILKALGLQLIYTIPMYLLGAMVTLPAICDWLYFAYILLTPLLLPNFATKEVLRKLPLAILSVVLLSFAVSSVIFIPLPLLFSLSTIAAAAIIVLPVLLVCYGLLMIFPYIASWYAKSQLDIELNKLPYLPDAALANSALYKIALPSQLSFRRKSATAPLRAWLKKRHNFVDHIAIKNLERQKLAAQATAIDELMADNNTEKPAVV